MFELFLVVCWRSVKCLGDGGIVYSCCFENLVMCHINMVLALTICIVEKELPVTENGINWKALILSLPTPENTKAGVDWQVGSLYLLVETWWIEFVSICRVSLAILVGHQLRGDVHTVVLGSASVCTQDERISRKKGFQCMKLAFRCRPSNSIWPMFVLILIFHGFGS